MSARERTYTPYYNVSLCDMSFLSLAGVGYVRPLHEGCLRGLRGVVWRYEGAGWGITGRPGVKQARRQSAH